MRNLIRQNENTNRGVNTLQREIDRLFDDFFGTDLDARFSGGRGGGSFVPSVDLEEADSEYRVRMDLPGVDRDHVDIRIDNNQLEVSGTREEENTEQDERKRSIITERSYGEFRRWFTLPSNIDVDNIEANFEDGVLTITIPKTEQAKPRQIKVGSKGGGVLRRIKNAVTGENQVDVDTSGASGTTSGGASSYGTPDTTRGIGSPSSSGTSAGGRSTAGGTSSSSGASSSSGSAGSTGSGRRSSSSSSERGSSKNP